MIREGTDIPCAIHYAEGAEYGDDQAGRNRGLMPLAVITPNNTRPRDGNAKQYHHLLCHDLGVSLPPIRQAMTRRSQYFPVKRLPKEPDRP